jgi:hypothetical protein
MLISGIMNVLFFTSMMSMMGMALNPMESQMAGESGASSEGAGGQGVTPFIEIPTAGNNVGQEQQSRASNNTANTSSLP